MSQAQLIHLSKLFVWYDRTLYLSGVPMPLRTYTVPGDQFVVCLQGQFRVRADNGEEFTCRSVLLRAGTTVYMENVDSREAIPAAYYLSPVSQDYFVVKEDMQREVDGNHYHHRNEEEIIREFTRLRDNPASAAEAYEVLNRLVVPSNPADPTRAIDERLVTVMRRIKETVRDNVPIKDLAAEVFLSESRLVKLFKAEIGAPITRFRLRYRLFVGVIYLSMGSSITEAALAAGFASTAHFSKTFRAMMGIQPSATYFRPPFLDVVLSEEVIAAAMERAHVGD